jgi:phage terminase Nu1 subunit (DNA packaging protein)
MSRDFVDVHGLAEAFECSDRKIQLLVLQGMPKASHGKYDLQACRKWYEQRQGQNPQSWGSISKKMARERANRTLVRAVRRELRSLPFRVAPQLIGKDESEILRILRGAIRDVSAALPSGKSHQGEN